VQAFGFETITNNRHADNALHAVKQGPRCTLADALAEPIPTYLCKQAYVSFREHGYHLDAVLMLVKMQIEKLTEYFYEYGARTSSLTPHSRSILLSCSLQSCLMHGDVNKPTHHVALFSHDSLGQWPPTSGYGRPSSTRYWSSDKA
jgi:hypothetical protein